MPHRCAIANTWIWVVFVLITFTYHDKTRQCPYVIHDSKHVHQILSLLHPYGLLGFLSHSMCQKAPSWLVKTSLHWVIPAREWNNIFMNKIWLPRPQSRGNARRSRWLLSTYKTKMAAGGVTASDVTSVTAEPKQHFRWQQKVSILT